ncbi:hypothetical protein [Rhodophyticola porphyridii]|uniref:hypothetical protein n=1 Tax=Rhodophyticola porphyridii TaxID=1852017 RepID=UPI001314EC06|nr:hypothetical protein [Rhodophyticola porphyridii]
MVNPKMPVPEAKNVLKVSKSWPDGLSATTVCMTESSIAPPLLFFFQLSALAWTTLEKLVFERKSAGFERAFNRLCRADRLSIF